MRKYFVLIMTVALLSPMSVIQSAAIAPPKNRIDSPLILSKFSTIYADLAQSLFKRQGQIEPTVSRAANVAESVAVRNLPAHNSRKVNSIKLAQKDREIENHELRRRMELNDKASPDGALQESTSALAPESSPLPPPSLVVNGLSQDDHLITGGNGAHPSDANGDVGPNHYLQVTNIIFRIFDKRGMPVTPPRLLSDLFAPLGMPCGGRNDGDPIALYDSLADRWMVSQFCIPHVDEHVGPIRPFHQVIAVSKTGDPAGEYFLYDFVMPGDEINDYPHFGVWSDGYYMTDIQFNHTQGFNGTGVFAFDRQKMLMGDPTASYIYFNLNLGSHPEGVGGMLPADIDGLTPPPAGAPCPFAYFTAEEYGDVADGMRIFDFHADFSSPNKSTFRERPESAAVPKGGIPVAAFNPLSAYGRGDVPQPPPSYYSLDSVSDVLMHRLQYRNFGGHESLVVTHTVSVVTGAGRRHGLRYYEFRKQSGNNPYTVREQASYFGPPDGTHRWMGSAAMNGAGDLAVAFSVSSSSIFPSIRYAARLSSDQPGGLRQGEQTIFTGVNSYLTDSRWGDYSSLSVDPSDDCSFWFTVQAAGKIDPPPARGWITKISKFSFSKCPATPKGELQGVVTNAVTGRPIPNALVKTTNGYIRNVNTTGNYLMKPVGVGNYTLTAAAPGYAPATVSGVAVTDGSTTVKNIALMPVNLLTPSSAAITSESIPDGVLEPGETVTVNLALKNTGASGASTTTLSGTLRATGGVMSPGVAQTYGAVAGGSSVSRPFTFRVDPNLPCGSTLTATLALQDGATDYRTVAFTFTLGLREVRYAGPPVVIPMVDSAGVNIPLSVSGFLGTVYDLNFKIGGTECTKDAWSTTVGLDDTEVEFLTVKLKSPRGTVVTLINRAGNHGNNFCKTILDDDTTRPSIQSITSEQAPYSGTFKPANPLSAFDGENPNGTWILNVADTWLGGHVRDFSLLLSPRECASSQTHSISGQVKIGTTGTALSGVSVKVVSASPAGFVPRTVQTDSNGNYSLTNLPIGRNYTLTLSKTNYDFTPAVRSYTNLIANQVNQNFTATLRKYSISGRVFRADTNNGISDVGVTITSPTPAGFTPRRVQTNSAGSYTITNLPAARSYTIKPTKSGYTFTPATRNFPNLSSNRTSTPGTSFSGLPTTALADKQYLDSVGAKAGAMIGLDEHKLLAAGLNTGALSGEEVHRSITTNEPPGLPMILRQYEKLVRLTVAATK